MATKKKKAARAPQQPAAVDIPDAAADMLLFGIGLLVELLAVVKGESAWAVMHDFLMGVMGISGYVLGVILCYLAILMERNEPILKRTTILMLGMLAASGTMLIFTNVQVQDVGMVQALQNCYENGRTAWYGGGLLGMPLGGTLLLLCGRPVSNIIVVILIVCVGLYFSGITPRHVGDWLHSAGGAAGYGLNLLGGEAHDRYTEWNAAREMRRIERAEQAELKEAQRREEKDAAAERAAAAAAERMAAQQPAKGQEPLPAGQTPAWMARLFGLARPADEAAQQEKAAAPKRSWFDVDLGPDAADLPDDSHGYPELSVNDEPDVLPGLGEVTSLRVMPRGGSLNEVEAAEFFMGQTPLLPENEAPAQPELPPEPEAPAPARVSAENAVAARSEPDEEGWVSIGGEPMEASHISDLVAAAMEKPQAGEQAAATAPAEEAEAASETPYHYPPVELLDESPDESDENAQAELQANAQKLVDTLDSFGVKTHILDISRGPSVTRYEVQPMAGVKISRITALSDDIALNLAVAGIRMEAPIPGKPAVGIEVPNRKKTTVSIRSIFESQSFIRMTSPLTIALGKDIAGVAQVADLHKMPHLLIAGSTGSGKSVCVNSIIMSLVFRSSPEDVRMILIDPKVVELAEYNGIPHLLMPVVTEPRKAAGALSSAVAEMERRYHMFAEHNVREIKSFNRMAAETPGMEKMPYIVIVIDELADLMMVEGKEVEDSICRIAQKARAAGMHLIVATQRPSVDVITGLIKANIPSRIAFAVSSQVDSRTILDGAGAEKLLGMGDMLFMPVGAPKPTRIQGTYVKDEEISRVLEFIKAESTVQYDEAMIAAMENHAAGDKSSGKSGDAAEESENDPMLRQAVEVVIDAGQASTSLLQRRCKLGYARAARIMDEMEEKGIIGPYEGAKPRAVLISRQQWLEMNANGNDL